MALCETLTEYAVSLAAAAVVVFAGYQTMGTTITSLLNSVVQLWPRREPKEKHQT